MSYASTLSNIKKLVSELESQSVNPIQDVLHEIRSLRNEVAELKELIRDGQIAISSPQSYRILPNTQPTVLKGEVLHTSGYTYTHPTPRPYTTK